MLKSCVGRVLMLLLVLTPTVQAGHVIMTGGPALKRWEQLRVKPDRHDNWWANFIRASTIRFTHIRHKSPQAKITWLVYRPGYVTRSQEDAKPYIQWIKDLGKKYNTRLVWVDSADEAITQLNSVPKRTGELVESFYYFGHSNSHAFMLDYGNQIMAVSLEWIHETDLNKIDSSIFTRTASCWSYGCYTGESMSYWWRKFLGVPLWGNTKSTRYAPVSNGMLPEGAGEWVNGATLLDDR